MSAMSSSVSEKIGPPGNEAAFTEWSQSYDATPNPLLTLEERYLLTLLPAVRGRDVLDAGCGSGRWLRHLATRSPRTLRGVDTSSAMLHVASQKPILGAELTKCSCDATPFPDRAFDLILSSFVLSYFERLDPLADEFTRIARGGCDLILTDMHPETQEQLGWKRSFSSPHGAIELDTTRHRLEDLIAIFLRRGWELAAFIEPEFGAPEQQVFAEARRMNRFNEAAGHPAIYLAHLRKNDGDSSKSDSHRTTTIRSARYAFGAQESARAQLLLAGDRVASMICPRFSHLVSATSCEIDLEGYLAMPGFVNAHDHLEFALYPHLASTRYANASAWAEDIHVTYRDLIATHRSVPKDVRLWWGGLRNLLCGVTTVCHHNPLHPVLLETQFPVRIVRDFDWAHSLAFDPAVRAGEIVVKNDRPFVIHACEGIDETARHELAELDALGLLSHSTVIVHGLAVDSEGADLMKNRDVSLVICPSSNQLLFGKLPSQEIFERIPQVALGSDSPLTAEGDLLDEVRFVIRMCGVEPALAWRMVTERAASVLQMQSGEGFLKPSAPADLVAIRDSGGEAQDRLSTLSAADIELVITGGQVMLASPGIVDRLPASYRAGLEPLWIEDSLRWLRAPINWLLQQAESVLGQNEVRLGGRRVRRATEWSYK